MREKCAMTGHIPFKPHHYAHQAPMQLSCAIWLVQGVFKRVKWLPNSPPIGSRYFTHVTRLQGVVWVVVGGGRGFNEVILRLSKCRK